MRPGGGSSCGWSLREIGGEHRRDEARGEQREEHLHRHRDAELLEECPAIPDMKLAGAKIAIMVSEIAITARPISSAASKAAR